MNEIIEEAIAVGDELLIEQKRLARLQVKVFGEQARIIPEGMEFVARSESVEGRRVMVLVPKGARF
jgi:hypothetical protein